MTMVAVGTQALGRYCLSSESPAFAHVWVTVIEGVSVTFAMFAILQFYFQTREDLAEYKPASKLLAIKLVIFLSFWQTVSNSRMTATIHWCRTTLRGTSKALLLTASDSPLHPYLRIGERYQHWPALLPS